MNCKHTQQFLYSSSALLNGGIELYVQFNTGMLRTNHSLPFAVFRTSEPHRRRRNRRAQLTIARDLHSLYISERVSFLLDL